MSLYSIQSDATSIGAAANDDTGTDLRTAVDRIVQDFTAIKAAFSPDNAGGIYLGGSAAANLFNDYEEGTFTPALVAGTSGTLALFASANTLNYTKIGRIVHITGQIQVQTSTSPLGTLRMTGLPFAVGNSSDNAERAGGVLSFIGLTAAGVSTIWEVRAGETELRILKFDGQSSTDDQAAQAAVNSTLFFDLSYTTDL
jgi:hypothetical protein